MFRLRQLCQMSIKLPRSNYLQKFKRHCGALAESQPLDLRLIVTWKFRTSSLVAPSDHHPFLQSNSVKEDLLTSRFDRQKADQL